MTARDWGCWRGLSGNPVLSHHFPSWILHVCLQFAVKVALKFIENKWWHYFDLMFALIAPTTYRFCIWEVHNKWCWGSTQNSCKWPTHTPLTHPHPPTHLHLALVSCECGILFRCLTDLACHSISWSVAFTSSTKFSGKC